MTAKRWMPVLDRLLASSELDENGCRIWNGPTRGGGYGSMWVGHRNLAVHRLAYETWVGPIPDEMQVDHLCFRPACINPEHLRLLTLMENARNQRRARWTHCVNGHEFTPENTRMAPNGRNPSGPMHRVCRACKRDRDRQRRSGSAA